MNVIRAWTFGPADGIPPAVAPFAHATSAGETLYVTGQMPTIPDGRLVDGGIVAQTDQVMTNLARVLELLGAGLSDVTHARAYLLDFADYAEFNGCGSRGGTVRPRIC